MNKSDIVLSCENLEKRYGSQLILYDIDLELRQGELVSILGQSGYRQNHLVQHPDRP